MVKGEELINAIKDQNYAMVQKLLNKSQRGGFFGGKKVNIDYQTCEGTTALHHAAILANTDLVCLLLRYNALINIQDKKDMVPLHYACWQGKLEPVEAFLKTKALPNVQSKDGKTPLHFAVEYGHFLASRALLQHDADPSIRDSSGKSAFDLGAELGRSHILDIMLMSKFGRSIINRFVSTNNHQNKSNTNVICPLHLAAKNGHVDIIKMLLYHGMDVNWINSDAGTCLHEAILNGHIQTVELLVNSGINLSIKNRLGLNGLEFAYSLLRTSTLEQIISILEQGQRSIFQVRAIKDFNNIFDPMTLCFTRGTIITVIERNEDGNWKGKIKRLDGRVVTGTFPSSYVQRIHPRYTESSNAADSDDSGIHQYDEEESSPKSIRSENSILSSSAHSKRTAASYINVTGPVYKSNDTSKDPGNSSLVVNFLGSTKLNNPSYDDVIVGQNSLKVLPQQTSDTSLSHENHFVVNQSRVITTSSSNEVSKKLHINNPGYEDVILNQRSDYSCSSHQSSSLDNQSNLINGTKHKTFRESLRKKGDMFSSKKNNQSNQKYQNDPLYKWLADFSMEKYATNFIENGFDISIISTTTADDLIALDIVNQSHKKKILKHIGKLRENSLSPKINSLPSSLKHLLETLDLEEYSDELIRNGINSIDKFVSLTDKNLQEMKMIKLGHQKKIISSIKKLSPLVEEAKILALPPALNISQYPQDSSEDPPKSLLSPRTAPNERKTSLGSVSSFVGADSQFNSELMAALTRRRKINLEDPPKEEPKPVDVQKPSQVPVTPFGPSMLRPVRPQVSQKPATISALPFQNNKKKMKGPPPTPPTRSSSNSISPKSSDSLKSQTINPVDDKPVFEFHKPSNDVFVFPQVPATTSKPPIMPKKILPKPVLPPKKIESRNLPKIPTKSPKPQLTPPPPSPGNRFDLSAIDEVEIESSSQDWPAPPSSFLEGVPPPSILPQIPLPKPPSPFPSDTHTCFEDDLDTGTVKRRPPSTDEQKSSSSDLPTTPSEIEDKIDEIADQLNSDKKVSANQILDDIGTMCDNLVLELDDMF